MVGRVLRDQPLVDSLYQNWKDLKNKGSEAAIGPQIKSHIADKVKLVEKGEWWRLVHVFCLHICLSTILGVNLAESVCLFLGFKW